MRPQIQIVRKPEVLNQFGFSRSVLYDRINNGLMPPPISLGSRAVGYLQHELDAVMTYIIAGRPNNEIKLLIKNMLAERQKGINKPEEEIK